MNYNLNNLGPNNFEHLVQSLCKKIIGEGVSIFGSGPDGQREATFNGKSNYPSENDGWTGYWVVQAKFKSPDTKAADYPWIKKCFEDEMKGFREKKNMGKSIPDNYLFFTNIVLTPVFEKGIKDRIEEIASSYNSLIPNIHIIGADDICRFLDGNRDIAVCYSSYILSGDILSFIYNDVREKEKARQNTFYRYLIQSFNDDYCSKMEQAGKVTEERVSIDKVYIDLKFKYENAIGEGRFIQNAIFTGNEIFRFSSNLKVEDELNEQKLSNKYVLKGSAGQGKSTVCQFLAQIYRATFIQNFCDTIPNNVKDFINRITRDDIVLPLCFRVPCKIELRLYSSWIIKRQSEEKPYDLITYISTMIGEKASEKFDNETLRLYLQKYSWVFFFDGLDEVSESSNRNDVMSEINRFIDVELLQADTDALFFATTRPEGYVGEFKREVFTHIDLSPLNKEDCFKYLDKLLNAIEEDSTKRKDYLNILNQGLENDQISFMMKTPLQATIIAILVRAGGEPPRDKYSLFKEYFDIILKREKQKGTASILNSNQDLVEGVYYLLGYELQKCSSTREASDALISLDRMKELIKEQLNSDGIDGTNPEYEKLLNDTYTMIVHRINFASEIKEGYIGFSIRSMQEFLAAVYILKTSDDQKLSNVSKKLAKSSYWKNTFIFLVECIVKNKTYYLDHLIDTVLGELNGSDISVNEINELASINYGSQVAITLLVNNIFKNKPKYENKLCKYISKYCELLVIDELTQVSDMSDNAKNELTNYLLEKENISYADYILSVNLMKDEANRNRLLRFSQEHAIEIVKTCFNIYNCAPQNVLYNAVEIALNQGLVFDINTKGIADIIKNIKIDTFMAKQALFKMTIKSILTKSQNSMRDIDEINKYFDCNFKVLIDIGRDFENEIKITEYLSVTPFLPQCNKADLERLIEVANSYFLSGLSLILNSVCSKEIEKYVYFYHNINNHIQEIEELSEIIVIRENAILHFLYKKVVHNPNLDINENFFNNLEDFLISVENISNFDELIKNCKNDFLAPRIYFTRGNEKAIFEDFIGKIFNIYNAEKVQQIPALCDLILFIYGCDYMYIYNDSLETSEDLLKLDSYIFFVLECARVINDYSVFMWFIIAMAFMKTNLNDQIQYIQPLFHKVKHLNKKYPHYKIKNDNTKIILDKIVAYIDDTENVTSFEYLYDFVLFACDYKIISSFEWKKLKRFDDRKIDLLNAIKNATNEVEVINEVLPVLENENVCEYLFELIKYISFPDYFVPMYVFLLKKYREEDNVENVLLLEKKIREYITSRSINV